MIQNQIVTRQTVHIHTETTNQSFLDMHYILKEKNITNTKFFLCLYNRNLIGVNPRDPNLHPSVKMAVLQECMINYWYFLRELVRVPQEGGTVGSGDPYKLHRGNLAMNFLFVLNYNMFVELPRQHGKTVAALCRYLWVFNFGATNSTIMFLHKNHDGSKSNLTALKRLRESLPDYLQMMTITTSDGKKNKIHNSVETLQHPSNYNKIKTLPSARNKALANGLGRGCTMPLHYYDEFAFMMYNSIIYSAATPAYSTASENARKHGSPYGILITTTPGDLLTDEGDYAYNILQAATPWDENYYDRTYEELEDLKNANTKSTFFYIKFTYQQLGSTAEYLARMVKEMQQNWPAIRREVLLEWASAATNCPFKTEDLERIELLCHEPINTLYFGSARQYQLHIYEKMDNRSIPIIGVDVAGALYQDSSAITIVDSVTTKVVATLNCNYIPSDDLADIIYDIVTRHMPNAVVNVERNGGFGAAVLQRLVKTSIKSNLYYEFKERSLQERFDGMHTVRTKDILKVFGTDSTRDVRARLIEILYERVNYHKDKFISPIIHNELKGMEVKKNGKVEHSTKTHDDQVFSYLMALHVWYEGKDLAQRFNIKKNSIRTDQDLEEAVSSIDYDLADTSVCILDEIDYNDDDNATSVLKYIINNNVAIMNSDFIKEQEQKDKEALQTLLSNRTAKDAYIKKYNLDPDDLGFNTTINDINSNGIPDSFFDAFNDADEFGVEDNYMSGNLGKEYNSYITLGVFDD